MVAGAVIGVVTAMVLPLMTVPHGVRIADQVAYDAKWRRRLQSTAAPGGNDDSDDGDDEDPHAHVDLAARRT